MMRSVLRPVCFAAAFAIGVAIAAIAFAQQSQTVPQTLAPLVDQAKKDGMTVVIISPETTTAETAAAPPSRPMTQTGIELRNEVRRLVMSAPSIRERLGFALELLSPDGTHWWLLRAVATALGGLAAGFLVSRLVIRWNRTHFRSMFNPEPESNVERIGFLVFRAAISVVNLSILFAVSIAVSVLFDTGHEPSRKTILVLITAYVSWRLLRFTIASNLLAPDLPRHRMVNITDAVAQAMYRDFLWVTGIAVTVVATSVWLVRLDLDGDLNKLLLIAASFIAAGLIGYLTIKYRRAVSDAIIGVGNREDKPMWLRFAASTWHLFGLLYLVIATGVSIVRLLLNLPSANILISAPAIAIFGAIGAYAIFYLLIEWHYRMRGQAFERKLAAAVAAEKLRREAEEKAREEAMSLSDDMGEEVILNNALNKPSPLPVYRPLFRQLAQRAAALLLTITATGLVLEAWSIRTADGRSLIGAFMETLIVAFVAWILYRAIAIYADARLENEAGSAPGEMIDPEEGSAAHGSSRLGTLLPLLRNVLLTLVVAIAGMIILSNLGVDVAPLFAGAGVVGLAVGFGSQALIRDIFSGAFFLFDDAFRKGEYVELGELVGTVEKISLRSFQLRHHNGPLHTIPFGEIKQLTNHSRDWVIMKLPLRLEFDVDLEKVRKILKKLGRDLLADPEVGKNFLQPLKSQGVVQIDDSALVLRVKFMTKPDDQWVTRKVVYASIQELFKREGIRFANREVTVRIAGDAAQSNDAALKQAASAAARSVLDAEARKLALPVKDDR